jgi:hypothetical protein
MHDLQKCARGSAPELYRAAMMKELQQALALDPLSE